MIGSCQEGKNSPGGSEVRLWEVEALICKFPPIAGGLQRIRKLTCVLRTGPAPGPTWATRNQTICTSSEGQSRRFSIETLLPDSRASGDGSIP